MIHRIANLKIIIFINNYIQEKEVIKYHIEDDILTIEITHKLSDNDKDSCIGDSVGEMEEASVQRLKFNVKAAARLLRGETVEGVV